MCYITYCYTRGFLMGICYTVNKLSPSASLVESNHRKYALLNEVGFYCKTGCAIATTVCIALTNLYLLYVMLGMVSCYKLTNASNQDNDKTIYSVDNYSLFTLKDSVGSQNEFNAIYKTKA